MSRLRLHATGFSLRAFGLLLLAFCFSHQASRLRLLASGFSPQASRSSARQAFLGNCKLYLGAARAAVDENLMRAANIRLAVNCTGDQPMPWPFVRSVQVTINHLTNQDRW